MLFSIRDLQEIDPFISLSRALKVSYNVGRVSMISFIWLLLPARDNIDFDVFKDINNELSSSSFEENSLRRGVRLEQIKNEIYANEKKSELEI